MLSLSSHQPNFIPWAGYFYKIAISDIFVIADDVDYTRKSYINRNRIKTPAGTRWLTLPVVRAPLGTPINNIEVYNSRESFDFILKLVSHNYSGSSYFKTFFPRFEEVLTGSGNKLSEINIGLIKLILKELNINTNILMTSKIPGLSDGKTDRIISICKSQNADTYISGFGGQGYQSPEKMKASNIECRVYDFIQPEYRQLWGDFEPGMSVIDLIFNCGPESADILMGSTR